MSIFQVQSGHIFFHNVANYQIKVLRFQMLTIKLLILRVHVCLGLGP
jgi:hypothetical protein